MGLAMGLERLEGEFGEGFAVDLDEAGAPVHYGVEGLQAEAGEERDDPPRHYLGHADAIKPNETAGEQARFWARFFGHGDDAKSRAANALLDPEEPSRREVLESTISLLPAVPSISAPMASISPVPLLEIEIPASMRAFSFPLVTPGGNNDYAG